MHDFGRTRALTKGPIIGALVVSCGARPLELHRRGEDGLWQGWPMLLYGLVFPIVCALTEEKTCYMGSHLFPGNTIPHGQIYMDSVANTPYSSRNTIISNMGTYYVGSHLFPRNTRTQVNTCFVSCTLK